MKYTTVRPGAALMAGALILTFASVSQAGWGHRHGGSSGGLYYGSSGASYGSSGYASSGGSSGYSAAYASSGGSSGTAGQGSSGGGHVGLFARLKAHMAAKKARHAARRASNGSSGYSSSGGSSGYSSYSSSGGSSGYSYGSSGSSGYSPAVSYGSSGASVNYGSSGTAGVYYGASKAKASVSSAALVSNVQGDAVYLTVTVPTGAKVFVNDKATSSTGAVRQFVSRGLKAGKHYKFMVRAELEAADGEIMVENKELEVTAGEREDLRFAFSDYDSPVETALTLNVPDGAQVVLAGNSTKARGESRVYRTSRLKPGQVWDDYEVEVRMGEQVKRRSVRLIGGDRLQLTFAFDQEEGTDKLASR